MECSEEGAGTGPAGQKGAVLIIAEQDSRNHYRTLSLQGEKIDLCDFSDGPDALHRRRPDVIVLDCGARSCKGLRMLRCIKTLYPQVPVIFLTRLSSENVVMSAYKSGAREFFRKPVSIAEVRSAVRGLLRIRRSSNGSRERFVSKVRADHHDSALCMKAASSNMPAGILAVVNYLEDHPSSPLTLAQMAKMSCLSKYHFARLFKKLTGLAPGQFAAAVRIEQAQTLLGTTDLSVKEVAGAVGFRDVGAFSRKFRRFVGMAPASYKACRKRGPADTA